MANKKAPSKKKSLGYYNPVKNKKKEGGYGSAKKRKIQQKRFNKKQY